MKQIVLKGMYLLNFKGIKNLKIDFEEVTDIFGANGTGKTTIFDAFTWCLFGKDSTERKDFEIKTIDKETGKVISEIDHEVSLELVIDNSTVFIKRVLKEKWTKKRGSETAEFTGNINELYWDDVPVSLSDFNKKVSNVLNEQVFKMVTSPTFFNSMKWPEQRAVLTELVGGEISDNEIAKGNSAYEKLLSELTNEKTLDEYNLQIKASIKKAKEDLKAIPTRIDEVYRAMPEKVDFTIFQSELQKLQLDFKNYEEQINNVNLSFDQKLKKVNDYKLKINTLKSEISIIESNAKSEAIERLKPDTSKIDALLRDLNAKNQELTTYQSSLQTLADKHTNLQKEKTSLEEKILAKRAEWNTENAKEITFNDNHFHCPTCKREFESGDVENKKVELTKSFNNSKQIKLSEISNSGKSLATELTNTENEIKVVSERITNCKKIIDGLKIETGTIQLSINECQNTGTENSEITPELLYESILSLNADYKTKIEELKKLEENPVEDITIDNSDLVEKKNKIQTEIDLLKINLSKKELIEAAEKRIEELKSEENLLAQKIASVEKTQFVIESFIREKTERLEKSINSKFKFIKFKMFEEQINGGYKETCEATIDGVSYSDTNTASKINAGLDVINTLSKFYGVSAPIFIDNAESVHTLIDTESQLIRLVVSEEAKKLTVFHTELVA